MAKLRNLRDVPPTGYRYTERATGHRFEATSYLDLIDMVRRHREYKGLDVATIESDVQEQICLCLDERHCVPDPGEDYSPVQDLTQRLTTDMATAANRGLVEFAKGGFQFVDPATAAARAEVCRTCPFNKPASGCSCHGVYRLIEALLPGARKHKGISVCMACGCSLQAKVNMPDEVVAKSITPGTVFPNWCWQHPLAS